jgi:hypothetical protein
MDRAEKCVYKVAVRKRERVGRPRGRGIKSKLKK